MGSGNVRQCLSRVMLTLLSFLRVLVGELVCGWFIAVFTDTTVYVYYDYMSVSVGGSGGVWRVNQLLSRALVSEGIGAAGSFGGGPRPAVYLDFVCGMSGMRLIGLGPGGIFFVGHSVDLLSESLRGFSGHLGASRVGGESGAVDRYPRWSPLARRRWRVSLNVF